MVSVTGASAPPRSTQGSLAFVANPQAGLEDRGMASDRRPRPPRPGAARRRAPRAAASRAGSTGCARACSAPTTASSRPRASSSGWRGRPTTGRPSSIAGVAGLFAGALSMATGEYVSVSTQRDTERALLAKERRELARRARGGAGRAGLLLRAEGAEPRARAAGGRASSPPATPSARMRRSSSASTPTTSPTRGTPPGPRCSPSRSARCCRCSRSAWPGRDLGSR